MSSIGTRLSANAGKLLASTALSSGASKVKNLANSTMSKASSIAAKGTTALSNLSTRNSRKSSVGKNGEVSSSNSQDESKKEDDDAQKKGVVVRPSQYELIVTISVVISAWLLSCIIVYVYWYKYNATLEYNRLIAEYNTQQLEIQMKRMYNISKAYVESRSSVSGNANSTTPNVRIDKRLHTEMIKTIEAYDRCNFVKESIESSSFPYTEVFVSLLLLCGIAGLIIASNLLNNPMKNLDAQKRLTMIRDEIRALGDLGKPNVVKEDLINSDLKNKMLALLQKEERDLITKDVISDAEKARLDDIREELSRNIPKKKMSGGNNWAPDERKFLLDSQRRLKIIRSKTERLSTELNFMKGDRTFNQVSMSASVLFTALYIAILMYSNAVKYNSQLYNSSIFLQSRCI